MRTNTLLGGINSSLAFRRHALQCFSQLQAANACFNPRSLPVLHREKPNFPSNFHSCGAPAWLLVWYKMLRICRTAPSKSHRAWNYVWTSLSLDAMSRLGKNGMAG
jgi:hypothetical protein